MRQHEFTGKAAIVTGGAAGIGRAGEVHVSVDATGQVWVAGHVTTCVTGTVDL